MIWNKQESSTPKLWTKTMVQGAVKYFADPRSIQTDNQKREMIKLLVGFEEVSVRGLIEPEGKPLAQEFLTLAHQWVNQAPKLATLYKELKKRS